MATIEADIQQLDIREKLAHIDQMLADHDRTRLQIDMMGLERERREQEMRFAPWALALSGMTAGAALFAAGAAFFKIMLP